MKRFLLAGAGLLALAAATTASAADLPRAVAPMPAPSPVVPYGSPSFSWSGFYMGPSFGYSWGRTTASVAGVDLAGSPSTNGFSGGGQIGWNYQFGPWVFGLETDAFLSDINGTSNSTLVGFPVGLKTDKNGTVRGRWGYAFDRSLFFATGGWAWAHSIASVDLTSVGLGKVTDDKFQNGWTVGAGWEYAFANNWSTKLEYRYAQYSAVDFTPIQALGPASVDLRTHSVLAGVNFKFW